MKNHHALTLLLCASLVTMGANAQNQGLRMDPSSISSRPKLFQSLPENISINSSDLNKIVNTPIGNTVNINLPGKINFQLDGEVVSAATESNVQTVVIRSNNYKGARFTLSKITDTDGTISYSGRMLSFQHGDLLELKNQDGHYTLIKRKLNDLITE
jgi:hypothetical protein